LAARFTIDIFNQFRERIEDAINNNDSKTHFQLGQEQMTFTEREDNLLAFAKKHQANVDFLELECKPLVASGGQYQMAEKITGEPDRNVLKEDTIII